MTSRGAPNIVLVMADQHRADVMGCAGDPTRAHAEPRPARRARASASRG